MKYLKAFNENINNEFIETCKEMLYEFSDDGHMIYINEFSDKSGVGITIEPDSKIDINDYKRTLDSIISLGKSYRYKFLLKIVLNNPYMCPKCHTEKDRDRVKYKFGNRQGFYECNKCGYEAGEDWFRVHTIENLNELKYFENVATEIIFLTFKKD